ncbi:MAG: hypothetical protein ACUBOA_11720 [Candidatus Loosdrechtia sp.]|uniref:hypothetical protein n=1 Tax=Candidatus Loosdrechtia sp. TaxID=3101272 RepID=UPI003A6E3504|nr:MAG: hypothetical protein QY305_00525 [Candidatus Jettenia sp. AMX2]
MPQSSAREEIVLPVASDVFLNGDCGERSDEAILGLCGTGYLIAGLRAASVSVSSL